MVEAPHKRFILPDRSYQAIVRSELRQLAEAAGFTGHRLGEVEIIIAEITSNLVKYADKGGVILARPLTDPGQGIEIIAMDDGPGMKAPLRMMEDGRSSKSSLGQGLGAIKRLSDVFDLFSLAGWGTILLSQTFVSKDQKKRKQKYEVNVLSVAKKNETLCGDGWNFIESDKRIRIVLIDGLGHGEAAHRAAQEAVRSFTTHPKSMPVDQLRSLHDDLKKTRGAVITVVHIEELNREVIYSGVGNITMKIISSVRAQGCSCYNGIVGHIMPASLTNHNLLLNVSSDLLVMHSDGLSSRWDIKKYPGILQHHSMILCGALYKDFDRGNDDTTILIGRFSNGRK